MTLLAQVFYLLLCPMTPLARVFYFLLCPKRVLYLLLCPMTLLAHDCTYFYVPKPSMPGYCTYFYVPRPAQVFYLLLCPKTRPGILLTSMSQDPPRYFIYFYVPRPAQVFYLHLLLCPKTRPGILLTSMSQDPPSYFTYFYVPGPTQLFYLLLCPKTLLPGLFNDVVELVIELVILSTRSSPGFNACTIKCFMQKSSKHMEIFRGIYSPNKSHPIPIYLSSEIIFSLHLAATLFCSSDPLIIKWLVRYTGLNSS